MTPDEEIVSVTFEAFPGLPPSCELTVECRFDGMPRAARGDVPAGQIKRKMVAGRDLAALVQLVDPAAGETVVAAECTNVRCLLANLPLLRTTRSRLLLRPDETADVALLAVTALSLEVPVEIAAIPEWRASALVPIADYFLHSPVLTAEARPFFDVGDEITGERRGGLWRACGETLGSDYFVDAEGRVSLSRRWAEADLFFGDLGDPPEKLRESEPWRRLAALPDEVFVRKTECSTCRHFVACGAFFKAHPALEGDCSGWRAAFDVLADEYARHAAGDLVGALAAGGLRPLAEGEAAGPGEGATGGPSWQI